MKKTIIFLALMLPTLAFAQWRVGANVGLSYNHPTIDKQYMTDLEYKDRYGVTFGMMGQYDFNDWLGVRAELDWTQKNYRQTRVVFDDQDYKYTNNYLLMPVMASFGFGGEKLRGFCNVGVYGGYWLNSHRKGTDVNNVSWSTALPSVGALRWRPVTTTAPPVSARNSPTSRTSATTLRWDCRQE